MHTNRRTQRPRQIVAFSIAPGARNAYNDGFRSLPAAAVSQGLIDKTRYDSCRVFYLFRCDCGGRSSFAVLDVRAVRNDDFGM